MMNIKFRFFPLMMLFLLLALSLSPVMAQETGTPSAIQTLWASTPGLDETAPAVVQPVPVEVVQGSIDDTGDARYLAMLDRLVSMVEMLTGFLPVGSLGTILIVCVGSLYVIVRLTPTKRDDEIVDRLWALVQARYFNNLPSVDVSAQRMADKYRDDGGIG